MARNEIPAASVARMPGESIKDYMERVEVLRYEEKRALRDQERERERASVQQDTETNQIEQEQEDASESVVLPVRGSQAAAESDGELTASQLIGMFGPRKEPQRKTSKSATVSDATSMNKKAKRKTSSEEYVGFGNEEGSKSRPPVQRPSDVSSIAAGHSNRSNNLPSSKESQSAPKKPVEVGSTRKSSGSGTLKPKKKRPSETAANAETTSGALKMGTLPDMKKTSHIRTDSAVSNSTNSNGKRSSTMESSRQDNTIGFDKLPKIQKKASIASPQSPDGAENSDGGIVVDEEERPPRWYQNEKKPKTRDPKDAHVTSQLESLTSAIKKRDVEGVRDMLHKLPFEKVSKALLKSNRMLDDDKALSLLSATNVPEDEKWPYDIRADAKELYTKWCRGVFATDLLHGIQLKSKGKEKKAAETRTVSSRDISERSTAVSSGTTSFQMDSGGQRSCAHCEMVLMERLREASLAKPAKAPTLSS